MKIKTVSTQLIRPSSPTPPQLRHFNLSFIDQRIPPSYIPLLLYYNLSSTHEDNRYNLKQPEMSRRLKRSMSDALVQFYPLAGRILDGLPLVDCSDEGILYIEATADGKISDIVRSPDSGTLDNLIPFKSNGSISNAEELLAVQATLFNCGGISVGICISHSIADGATLSSFINCWAAIARRDQPNVDVSPLFNSATLFPPRNTPDFRPNFKNLAIQAPPVNLLMERLLFPASAIDELKQKAAENSSIIKPTRVEVVTAFLWSRCLVAKGLDASHKSVAFHPVNLRGRVPALTERSFGNVFQMTHAENAGETNWTRLVEKLRAAFGKIDNEYVKMLSGEKGCEIAKENFQGISKFLATGNVAVLLFSSYCRFPIYEVDFGWGKPVWVSSASFSIKDMIMLFDSVVSPGGIEVWIVMVDHEMERLRRDSEIQRFTSFFGLSR
ncbi:Tabersonine-19-hydroxy-O-acetyltransferase [Sesamum alatum]|uniref:Tabersonine-19-hydroxy-O-acetyltransferase n=1 Tax=Sesamum alatum TaxID=300844 RepID=A0AAE2C9R3_9LAMI|nr:Tabersonine-19-hydroxy-O-acetyltransferase [Sesamum alatum]